jgi:hypothetical protein
MRRRWWFLIIPFGHAAIFAVYWLLSYDPAGTVMSLMFAGAIALIGLALLPTLRDVGPTAPVDPDWRPNRSDRRE